MIYKVKDKEHKFLLITVPAEVKYKVLYMLISEINQVQLIARQISGKWEAIDWGHRTIVEKLPSKWTVEISIEELTLEQVRKFCPQVGEIEYSTRMIEDLKIRNYQERKNGKH